MDRSRQIEIAVAIHIAPGHAGHQTVVGLPGRLIRQPPILVEIELAAPFDHAECQVEITVAVYIAPGHAGRCVRMGRLPARRHEQVAVGVDAVVGKDPIDGTGIFGILGVSVGDGQIQVAVAIDVAPGQIPGEA